MSRRAKEAIKTGLAMAIAYGIALSMDWEKPLWTGFTVAMISLATAGQSLNKAAMRMVGTLVAVVVSLALIAIFPQDRWLLMASLSVYVGICTYMMTGKTNQYAWFVSAFVCLIIIVSVGPGTGSPFFVAVERAQETGLGVVVYGLIAAFLWPQSSRSGLEGTSRKLIAVEHQLFQCYREIIRGGTAEASQALRMQEVGLAGQLGTVLSAAETDSYTVWEVRHLWRQFHDDSLALGEALERWRESFPEVQELDLEIIFPSMEAFCDELAARFSAIETLLADGAPEQVPQSVSLTVERSAVGEFSHFQLAAVTVTKAQLDRVEELSRRLLDGLRDIKGSTVPTRAQRRRTAQSAPLGFDPDRLIAVARVIATFWVAFLIWVYVDPPGHQSFVQMAVTFAMGAAMLNLPRASMLFMPFVYGSVIGGVAYVFVMPQLSGFAELGAMIFVVTAAIYYLFSEPRQGLMKSACIIAFLVLISVQNEQSYNFAAYANSVAMIMLAVALLVVMSYIPASPRPEKVFLRLFARFFRHVDILLSRMAVDWEQKAGVTDRLRVSLYRGDLMELSQKLAAASRQIDSRSFPDNSPQKVQALVASLTALAFRMKELVDSRANPQAAPLVRELLDDLRAWRLVVQAQILLWADDPEAAARQSDDLQERLNQRLARLEARVEEAFQRAGDGKLEAEDYENFYLLLGDFRGLSEAGVAFVNIARDVNWAQWREARF